MVRLIETFRIFGNSTFNRISTKKKNLVITFLKIRCVCTALSKHVNAKTINVTLHTYSKHLNLIRDSLL